MLSLNVDGQYIALYRAINQPPVSLSAAMALVSPRAIVTALPHVRSLCLTAVQSD